MSDKVLLQKNTPTLRFPGFYDTWPLLKLKDVATYRRGSFPQPYGLEKWYDEKNGTPFVQVFDVGDNFRLKETTKSHISELAKPMSVFVPSGSVVLTIQGSIGRIAITQYDAYVDRTLLLFKEILKPFDKLFFAYAIYLCFEREKKLAPGGTIKTITKEVLSDFLVPVPDISEQNKVSKFLSLIDTWLDKLRSQKAKLEDYKMGAMQKLFAGEVRFSNKDKNYPEWKEITLGDCLNQTSERNTNKELDRVLSVSNKRGFIIQEEQFQDYRVASKDTSNYKVVSEGDFAYNPSRINVGSIALLKKFDAGIVSPMYVVFKTQPILNAEYLLHFTKTKDFSQQVKAGCSGSVRDSLSFDAMCQFTLSLPSIEEQQRIVDFLNKLDALLDMKETQIKLAEQWKKGLVQKMFI